MRGVLARLGSFFRNLLRGSRLDRSLDAELNGYVEMLASEKIEQGMEPERARREARIALGGVEQVKEQVRAVRAGALLEQVARDCRYALRGLRKAPVFTLTATATLALGIGANTAMFSVVDALLLRPLPVTRPDRLVAVYHGASGTQPAFSYPQFAHLSQRTDVLEGVAAWATQFAWIRNGGDVDRVNVHTVSPGYFDLLGLAPQPGTSFARASEEASRGTVVISDRVWRTRFDADPSIVGRPFSLNGQPVTVAGVAPAAFNGLDPSAPTDIWMTFATLAAIEPGWDFRAPTEIWINLIARLGEDVPREAAESALTLPAAGVDGRLEPVRLVPAATPLFDPELRTTSSRLSALTSGVAGFILLIACANVANLLLVRGNSRRREIGLRMAIGATRARMAGQLVVESLILAAAGFAGALLLADWTIRGVIALAPRTMIPPGITVSLDGRVMLFAAALSLLTAAVFGLIPVLQAARLDLLSNVKGAAAGDPAGRWAVNFRRGLVVSQVALSAVLLVGAGLFLRTLVATLAIAPGYDVNRVLLTSVDFTAAKMTPAAARTAGARMLDRLRTVPGVEGAAFGQIVPFSGAFVMRPVVPAGVIPNAPDVGALSVPYSVVSEGYFRTLGMPLRGRDFAATDTEQAPRVAIVNETLARRYWPGQNPIGKRVTMPLRERGPEIEVVGVVPDGKYVELTEEQHPFVYVPWKQMHRPRLTLHVRSAGDPGALAGAVRAAIREAAPEVAFFNTMELSTYLDRSTSQQRLVSRLLLVFGAIALAVAAVGVYGLTAFTVARRSKELGVRMALGARPSAIVRMLLAQSTALVATGLAFGLGAAALLTRFVETMLFRVEPLDPVSFAAGGVLLALTLLAATLIPARRATQVDPVAALRTD
jgi:predicted permease